MLNKYFFQFVLLFNYRKKNIPHNNLYIIII